MKGARLARLWGCDRGWGPGTLGVTKGSRAARGSCGGCEEMSHAELPWRRLSWQLWGSLRWEGDQVGQGGSKGSEGLLSQARRWSPGLSHPHARARSEGSGAPIPE